MNSVFFVELWKVFVELTGNERQVQDQDTFWSYFKSRLFILMACTFVYNIYELMLHAAGCHF